MDLSKVRLLKDAVIRPGDRWLYIADFNIEPHDLENECPRIDTELSDILHIADNWGVVAILAHRGRYSKDKRAPGMADIAQYMSVKTDRDVTYYDANTGQDAIDFVRKQKPGSIVIMGNTRHHKGEEENDKDLAAQFAELGQFVAVGGFGKAHRKNASNVGILKHMPGYLPSSQLTEMDKLEPFSGIEESMNSVAVLGGIKKEKVESGLKVFLDLYDSIIPGGIVLNNLLKLVGYDVGSSIVEEKDSNLQDTLKEMNPFSRRARIYLPDLVYAVAVPKKGKDIAVYEHSMMPVPITKGIPEGVMIVGYEPTGHMKKALLDADRLVAAGTPDLSSRGYDHATKAVEATQAEEAVKLGGNTGSDLNLDGETSTGGGAALYLLEHRTTKVFEALKDNYR